VTPLFMSTVAALCAVLAGVIPASAQYPTRPVTLIVPFAAGGPTDTVARIIAEHMAKTLGQSIVVENDAGAGGTTATARGSSAG
jgi:tripartite-type tricarboxylate transporter receptor subunit TctC